MSAEADLVEVPKTSFRKAATRADPTCRGWGCLSLARRHCESRLRDRMYHRKCNRNSVIRTETAVKCRLRCIMASRTSGYSSTLAMRRRQKLTRR